MLLQGLQGRISLYGSRWSYSYALFITLLSLVMEGIYSIGHKQVTDSSHHLEEGVRQVGDSVGSPKGMSGTIGMFLS